MDKRKYVLTASLGVIGALLLSGTASAAVTGFNFTATVSPKNQSAKTFGAAAISSNLEASYTGEFARQRRAGASFSSARTSSSRRASWPSAT